ncbi:dicarboxylate/amino acid:cation symporter [Hutsoniella sourekii]
MSESKRSFKAPSMTTQIMIALVLGIIAGIYFPSLVASIGFLGDIFLKLIQMGIVLLVLGQIVAAIGHLEIHEFGKIGLGAVVTFALSSIAASAWGVLFGMIFQPGAGIDTSGATDLGIEPGVTASISDVLVGFFPSNIIGAMAEGNIVQVITFAIFFGVAVSVYYSHQSRQNQYFLNFLGEFNEMIIHMVRIIMTFAPVGIFALICSAITDFGPSVILPMLKYLLVYGGATLVFLVIWIILVSVVCRVSIMKLVKKMSRMSILAFTTTSSAITLPTAIEDAERQLGMHPDVSRLVLPLGMSLNSNGSAMFMSITIITVAQIYGVSYGLSDIFFIIFLSTLASLANAVVPGGGLVSLSIVIPQMGLPVESIALFAGVEWFTGMIRTILNVNSDVYCGLLVANSVDAIDRQVLEADLPAE